MVPTSPFHPHARRRRAVQAGLVIGLQIFCLGAAYFRTQVINNDDFVLRSEENRLNTIAIPAPRGAIYDRNGKLIAETVTTYRLNLQPTGVPEAEATLAKLKAVLEMSDTAAAKVLKEVKRQPHQSTPVASNLSFKQVSWIEEHRAELPGALLEPLPLRRYPDGEAVAHLVGYVGEISERELADSTWRDYKLGQQIGKAGLERQYERLLGGTPGERYVEVDARGRVIGQLAPEQARAPVPGTDIHLTIDVELQRFAQEIFPKKMNGALVAMVPSTGEILALYSNPSYDPNLLVGGIKPEVWRTLNQDPRKPLLNRATVGIYPPGSTWKLATALIGLERGVITAEAKMPFPCTGGWSYMGRYSRCWKKEGHGYLDLAGAIANSCNVYFYQLGVWLGLNRLANEGTRLGFSRKTGVDLPSEKTGTFPTNSEWYRKAFKRPATPSEVMSLSIGQGPNAQTPLRMAQFFSALAGNGRSLRPHLRAGSRLPVETDLKLSESTLRAARTGLARVVEAGGTAHMSSLKRWKLYGKTGTSQNSQDLKRPHAWFTGFAGKAEGEPEVVVAAVVEFGEHGSSAAAPLAAKLADFYLNKKHGFKTDARNQTLAERLGVRAE